MQEKKRVVVLGGGTGSMAVLSGLKTCEGLSLSVIVNMTDDGGSNAVVRDEFGLLPLSDLRKSIIALAPDGNQLLRSLFTYRFPKGEGLKGHTLGNLMMMGLCDLHGGEAEAVRAASTLFGVQGKVIPVTLEQTDLVAEYSDGSVVASEHVIDEPEHTGSRTIRKLRLSRPVAANPEALEAILAADYLIAGPGDLFTTTLANIIVPGIAEAIVQASGHLVFITNLMEKHGQTEGMSAADTVRTFATYCGRTPDVVVAHAGALPEGALEHYRAAGRSPIVDDLPAETEESAYRVVREDIVAREGHARDSGDTLIRSFVRHDPGKLAAVLVNQVIL